MSDARRKILERRAAFVAAALASMGAVSCQPQVCLSAVADDASPRPTPPDTSSPPVPEEVGPAACLSEAPMPCLSPPPMIVDAAPPRKPDAGPKPQPCLKMAPAGDF